MAEWVTVFAGGETLTTALLDRLTHHATMITTKGTVRLIASLRAQLRRAPAEDETLCELWRPMSSHARQSFVRVN
ncbi:MAG: ATP-binding protein [Acidobacteria bacterium]|nr:ATP-binding protein [Acidobacteriota bacterium]